MPQNTNQVTSPLQAQLIALAVISSTIIYVIVCLLATNFILPEDANGFVELDPQILRLLAALLMVVAIATDFAAGAIRKILLNKPELYRTPFEQRVNVMLVGMAMVHTPSIYGLILCLLNGFSPVVWAFWAMGLAGGIWLFPSRAWLQGQDTPPSS